MKYIIIIIIAIGGLFTGCDSWLDIKPKTKRLSSEYWNTEDDVKNTVLNCYSRMRECTDNFVKWGELRADVLLFTGGDNEADEEALLMNQQNITGQNEITNWYDFYHVINAANSVVQYAPLAMENDPLLDQEQLEEYMAEAKAIRALMYFYLVRTFGEVPLVTEAYLTDAQELFKAKSPEDDIIHQIIVDLKWSEKRLPEVYVAGANKWENKCRITGFAARMLLTDVYLWAEKYEECLYMGSTLINSKKYKLIAVEEKEEDDGKDKEEWFENFYPGLTDESVLELYFDAKADQKNNLYKDFSNANKYNVREIFRADFDVDDVRGLNNSFTDAGLVWKFIGNDNDGKSKRAKDNQSPNWIFYRFAELHFMMAEAFVMRSAVPTSSERRVVMTYLNLIRERAGTSLLTFSDVEELPQKDLLLLVIEDKKKEFVGEGKRWYDMVRLAKKQDFTIYKSMVLDILLENVPLAERPLYQTILSHDGSFFLPIHEDQIYMGQGILEQNPAYQ